MASDISLSSSVRSNLLSLQGTADMISRTQSRLSTGLKVSGPVDDPVSYFQAKSLNDRADDFSAKKDGIDQGVSTLSAALDAVKSIEKLVKQLKGLALNAKSATTSTEVSNIVNQFNDLRTQINNLATDASYQGLNLVAGTGSTLKVDFSNLTSSVMQVESEDLTSKATGLNITSLKSFNTATPNFDFAGVAKGTVLSAGDTITLTLAGTASTTLGSGAYTGGSAVSVTYGTFTLSLTVGTAGTTIGTAAGALFDTNSGTVVLSAGTKLTLTLRGSAETGAEILVSQLANSATVTLSSEIDAVTNVGVNFADTLNSLITDLESDLTTIRSKAQKLGTNVALLQTRLDFTKSYVNTLAAGAGKLTVADLNEEGANLLALQTRQQLGVQALSFASQSEQSVLGLFR